MQKSRESFKENRESNLILNDPGVDDIVLQVANGRESALRGVFDEPPIEVMPTLPKVFKSLIDTPIDITDDNRNSKDIIELLGDALGVSDYKTNIASFWFLDFIAFQVLQYEASLDSHGRSLMVSWLAGEMKLIQEQKLSRIAFFDEMAKLFMNCAEKLERGQVVQHWDLMLTGRSNEDISVQTNVEQESKEREESIPKITKRRVSSRDRKKSRTETRKKINENPSRKKSESERKVNDDGKDLATLKNNSHSILGVIMEATYNISYILSPLSNRRYGNSFHYALIVAAFVDHVLLQEYSLPFSLRTPRPVKAYEVEKDDKKIIKKSQDSAAARKGLATTTKSKDSKKSKRNSKDSQTVEIILKPPTPMTEEEILARKREFILPLMEANEASTILESNKEITQGKNLTGQKRKL